MATTFRFKLLAGTHDVGTGDERKTYKFGEKGNDIVESDKPLDKLFKNKFERLGEATAEPRDNDNTLNESGRAGDDPEHLKAKGNKLRAKTQQQLEEESPRPRKVKPAAPEYEEDYDASVKETTGDDGEEEDAPKPKTRGAKGKASAEVEGDDVTDEFEGAADAGFTVHKDAKAKVFRVARDGQQVGEDYRNKTEAKKALKAELEKESEADDEE